MKIKVFQVSTKIHYGLHRKEENMLETEIEKHLKAEVQKAKGWCIKLTSPSGAGLPDRLVLMPKGRCFFAELKAPGKKPRKLQKAVFRQLEKLGHKVYVIDSKEKIGEFINEICSPQVSKNSNQQNN